MTTTIDPATLDAEKLDAFMGLVVNDFGAAASTVLVHVGECLAADRLGGETSHAAEVGNIMEALERGLAQGERETRNVIALSFARDSELESFFEQLRLLMGPRTRAQLHGR